MLKALDARHDQDLVVGLDKSTLDRAKEDAVEAAAIDFDPISLTHGVAKAKPSPGKRGTFSDDKDDSLITGD